MNKESQNKSITMKSNLSLSRQPLESNQTPHNIRINQYKQKIKNIEIIPLNKYKLIPDSIRMLSGSSLLESKIEVKLNHQQHNSIQKQKQKQIFNENDFKDPLNPLRKLEPEPIQFGNKRITSMSKRLELFNNYTIYPKKTFGIKEQKDIILSEKLKQKKELAEQMNRSQIEYNMGKTRTDYRFNFTKEKFHEQQDIISKGKKDPQVFQTQYIYKEDTLYPVQQKVSPQIIELINQRFMRDMQKAIKLRQFQNQKQKFLPKNNTLVEGTYQNGFPFIKFQQGELELTNQKQQKIQKILDNYLLRNGEIREKPLSENLTQFNSPKLNQIVEKQNREKSHMQQNKEWRKKFLRQYLADEIHRIQQMSSIYQYSPNYMEQISQIENYIPSQDYNNKVYSDHLKNQKISKSQLNLQSNPNNHNTHYQNIYTNKLQNDRQGNQTVLQTNKDEFFSEYQGSTIQNSNQTTFRPSTYDTIQVKREDFNYNFKQRNEIKNYFSQNSKQISSLNQQKQSQNTAIESGQEETILSENIPNSAPFQKNDLNASNMSSFDNSNQVKQNLSDQFKKNNNTKNIFQQNYNSPQQMKDLSFININNQRNESSYTSSLAVNQNYIKEEKSLNVVLNPKMKQEFQEFKNLINLNTISNPRNYQNDDKSLQIKIPITDRSHFQNFNFQMPKSKTQLKKYEFKKQLYDYVRNDSKNQKKERKFNKIVYDELMNCYNPEKSFNEIQKKITNQNDSISIIQQRISQNLMEDQK